VLPSDPANAEVFRVCSHPLCIMNTTCCSGLRTSSPFFLSEVAAVDQCTRIGFRRCPPPVKIGRACRRWEARRTRLQNTSGRNPPFAPPKGPSDDIRSRPAGQIGEDQKGLNSPAEVLNVWMRFGRRWSVAKKRPTRRGQGDETAADCARWRRPFGGNLTTDTGPNAGRHFDAMDMLKITGRPNRRTFFVAGGGRKV